MADYLPPVITKLSADIDDFLAKLIEAKEAVKTFAEDVADIPIRFDIDEASLDRALLAADAMAKAGRPEVNITFNVDQMSFSEALTEIAIDNRLMQSMFTDNSINVTKNYIESLTAIAAKEALVAIDARDMSTAISTTTRAAGGARTAWNLWGLSLHWIIAGGAEIAAVTIPAIVAALGAIDVGLQGSMDVYNRVTSLYAATEALGGAFNMTGGEAYGLKGNLQAAQDAADPQIWELLGAAINGVSATSGGFVSMGQEVIRTLDAFAAHVDIALKGSFGTQLTGLVSKGAEDLTELGQTIGNLLHFLANAAGEMPGLAEVLLHLLDDFSRLLVVLTNPAWYNFGGHLITVAMGFEEAGRWGGVLLRVVSPLVIGFGSLAATLGAGGVGDAITGVGWEMGRSGAMAKNFSGAMTMLATTPAGLVLALGAAVVIVAEFTRSTDAAYRSVDQMESTLDKVTPTQGMFDILKFMPQLENQSTGASKSFKSLSDSVSSADSSLAKHNGNLQSTIQAENAASQANYNFSYSANAQKTSIDVLNGELGKQAQKFVSMTSAAEYLAQKYGVTIPQAYSLMDNAGLNINTMFNRQNELAATAKQEIQNLVQGYQAMSGSGSAVVNTANAVNVQLGLQGSKLQTVNQAWDQFLSNAIGGTQAFGALETDLTTIGNVTEVAKSKIAAFSQGSSGIDLTTQQVAQALTSFSGTSGQVWQNYDSALQQAGQVTDWWRTTAASGVTTGNQLNQAIATTAQQLLPYAANSQAAAAELGVLVQEAGGPAITNYQQLKKWVDANALSQGQYNKLLSDTTTQMSDVTQAAQQFDQTLQSDLIQSVAQGSINLGQITTDTHNFTVALEQNGPQSSAVHQSMVTLAGDFSHAGMNAQTAGSLVYQMGLNEGLTKTQAYQLDQQMQNLIGTLKKTPAVETTKVTLTGSGTWVIQSGANAGSVAGGGGHTAPGMSTGGRVPGWGGGDSRLIMVEPGEAVVDKDRTRTFAPLLGAMGVPGFATGGIVPNYQGAIPGMGPWYTQNWNATVSAMGKAMEQSMQAGLTAMQSAAASANAPNAPQNVSGNVALGKRMAAAYGWGSGTQWDDLYALWMRESGWSAYAVNKSSGAAGIAQSLGHGPVPLGDAAAQIAWGLNYIKDTYGSPAGAWAHEVAANWYDQGGMLPPGLSLAMNGTGRPEPVGDVGGVAEINVYLDGKQIYQSTQKITYKVNRRNNTKVTGKMTPGK